jgi:hypothetical protein
LPGSFGFVGSTGTSLALAIDYNHTAILQYHCINTVSL